jgi:hypothetical protein
MEAGRPRRADVAFIDCDEVNILTELPGHTCAPVVACIEYDDHGRWERNSNRGRPDRTQASR